MLWQQYLAQTVRKNWNWHPEADFNLWHSVLGLTEEAGEVAGLVKKKFFYGKTIEENPRGIKREDFLNELGDVAYYFFNTMDLLGYTLEEVLEHNHKKLAKRHKEGFRGNYDKEQE